jgi:hypothetical protein
MVYDSLRGIILPYGGWENEIGRETWELGDWVGREASGLGA